MIRTIRLLVLAAVLATGASIAHAQVATTPDTAARRGPRFGLVLGTNLANISGDAVDGDTRTGLLVGASLHAPITRSLAFQPELHYSQKGSRSSAGGLTAKLNLDYIELPLLVHYQFPTAGRLRPFVLGGPTLAYQVRCNVRISQFGTTSCDDEGFGDADGNPLDVRRFEYGVALGGGIAFALGGQTASLGVRYGLGLADIAEGENVRNRTIQFVFGVRF